MLDRGTEQRIIDLALDEGLLTPDDAAEQPVDREWSPRLARLVHDGLLSQAAALRLLERATGGTGAAGSGRADALRSPPPGEERFELGPRLGQGGMGEVFKAYDHRLRRPVALKFLKGDDPQQVSRFLREAQAQARVDHENVCKVYEAGEREGRPYIAMQYIEGRSLFVADGDAAGPSADLRQMTVDQKVRVMKAVAEGIQAAHREGLIHRDIKPSNVMLERTETGDWKPYVLDFGLAREVASAGVTSMGLAAGTPNFMAPEQARGEGAALDRRTDVYGLGATLYAVLSGRPPFEGPSSLDVLIKVTEQDPSALTGVPGDLAVIVAKCLDKEPSLRYESARALADDLGRYLEGEPILARQTSLTRRLLKKARKHRKLVAAASLTAAAFVFMGATTLRTQLRSQERARLAGVFGQEVKAIESLMRIAYLVPEHDIRPERQAVRQRMAVLAGQVSQLGSVAEGPGRYALGRGYLALGEYDKARADLERAWRSGYREREVAYALGQALGALYQKELAAANRISDEQQRRQRAAQAERDYRDPALEYLRLSRGLTLDSSEYAESLLAFYEKKYDQAAAKAQAAYRRLPWLYEARALEGRIQAAIATEQTQHGDLAGARATYGRAEAALRAAQEIGRSDARIPADLCGLAFSLMHVELYTAGAEVEPYFEKGMAACEQALRVDPEEVEAYNGKVELLWRLAESRSRRGQDTGDIIDQAVEVGRQALVLTPDDAKLLQRIATAHTIRAQFAGEHGVDPVPSLEECIRLSERALAIDPRNPQIRTAAASCYHLLAMDRAAHGQEAEATFDKAAEHIGQAVALRQEDLILSNQSVLYLERAAYELGRGRDPSALLAKALQSLDTALKMNPRFVLAHINRAAVNVVEAQYRLATGKDPSEALNRAEEAYQSTLAINPRTLSALTDMADVETLRARYEMDEGRDPSAAFARSRRWLGKAREILPKGAGVLLASGRLALMEGRWQAARRGAGALEAAVAAAGRAATASAEALKQAPSSLEGRTLLAETLRYRAEWRRRQGRPVPADVARGLAVIDAAVATSPHEARAFALRGALLVEKAYLDPSRRSALHAQARESLERARSMNRFLEREFGALLAEVRADS